MTNAPHFYIKGPWPGVKVPVFAREDLGYTEIGYKRVASYKRGWPWPFSLLRAGRIEILGTHVERDWILAHEMQHAKDMLSPAYPFRKAFSKSGRLKYRLMTRAEAQECMDYLGRHLVEGDMTSNFAAGNISRIHRHFPSTPRKKITADLLKLGQKLRQIPIQVVT